MCFIPTEAGIRWPRFCCSTTLRVRRLVWRHPRLDCVEPVTPCTYRRNDRRRRAQDPRAPCCSTRACRCRSWAPHGHQGCRSRSTVWTATRPGSLSATRSKWGDQSEGYRHDVGRRAAPRADPGPLGLRVAAVCRPRPRSLRPEVKNRSSARARTVQLPDRGHLRRAVVGGDRRSGSLGTGRPRQVLDLPYVTPAGNPHHVERWCP